MGGLGQNKMLHGKQDTGEAESALNNPVSLFGENVRVLISIRMCQCRKRYLLTAALFVLAAAYDTLGIMVVLFQGSGQDIMLRSGRIPYLLALLAVAVFSVTEYNIIGDTVISMYPGTVMSRFCARAVGGYLTLLLFTVFYGLLYLINSAVLHVLALPYPGFDVSYTFSLPYLASGMFQMAALSCFVYSLCILAYVVIHRLGDVLATVLVVAAIFVFDFLIYTHMLDLYRVWDFLCGRDMSLALYAGLLFLAGGVCFGISLAIVSGMKAWRASSVYLLGLFLIGGFIGSYTGIHLARSVDIHRDSPLAIESYGKESLQKDYLFSYQDRKAGRDLLQKIWEGDITSEEGYSLVHSCDEVVSEKEAKKQGYVDQGFSLKKGEMVLHAQALDTSYEGRYLFEKPLKYLEIYQKGNKVFWKREKCANVFSTAFGIEYTKCGDSDNFIGRRLEWNFFYEDITMALIAEDSLVQEWKENENLEEWE